MVPFAQQARGVTAALLVCFCATADAAELHRAQKPRQGPAPGKLRPLSCHRSPWQDPLAKRPCRWRCVARLRPARAAGGTCSEGMVSRHRNMPQIEFSDEDVDAILAYLYALAVKK